MKKGADDAVMTDRHLFGMNNNKIPKTQPRVTPAPPQAQSIFN